MESNINFKLTNLFWYGKRIFIIYKIDKNTLSEFKLAYE